VHKHLRLTIAAAIAASGLTAITGIGLSAAAAAAAAAPNCPTVSAAVVQSALGGSPVAPPAQTANANSFDGYKASVVTCSYASTINISYSTPATTADYKLALATLSHATAEKVVSGIGNAAFSGTGSNTISAYNAKTKKSTNTTVKTVNLWVLVTGKTFVEISASGVTLAKEKALAKKMVPLV
jgi:ribosomal protein L28